MATTTNFGWETPDDTDLVKDGALAMRTLGNAIDASLVDLKGGTTGQVLSKTSNTDMDFTWVTSDDANAIQNAIVDAKGDLITATAADTPARLAVGSNGDTLVANSAASNGTGLEWQGNYAAGKNKIINGDFSIWQRGTSFSNPNGVYAADRWLIGNAVAVPTFTVSQQSFTPGTAPVSGYESQYFLRCAVTNIGSSTAQYINTRMEDVRTFAGQTVTISFWAKFDTSRVLQFQFIQNFGTGGSGDVVVTAQNVTVTNGWARYSASFNIPSISGKTIGAGSYLQFMFITPAANYTLDLWGIQVERGTVATAFQTATGTLQGELAACQRYYWRVVNGIEQMICNANAYTASDARGVIQFPVTMRTAPNLVVSTGTNYYYFQRNGAQDLFDSLTIYGATTSTALLYNNTEIASTAGQGGFITSNNASSSVAFNAELQI